MKAFHLMLLPCLLASCGSIQTEGPGASQSAAVGRLTKVVVKDFANAYSKGDSAITERYAAKFADQVAAEIRRVKPGVSVTRNGAVSPATLVVSGEVTRCEEGTAALRALIGMGAGSSYFDARVRLADGTGKALSTVVVDKNSWGLGGLAASTQTVDTFVAAGAQKTAEQAATFLK